MKTKCSNILKVVTSLVLAVLMMIGSVSNVVGAIIGQQGVYSGGNTAFDAALGDADTAASADSAAVDGADDADEAESAPAFTEENEIVRGMKSDLADTGAAIDLTDTGDTDYYFWISSSGGSNASNYGLLSNTPNTGQYSVSTGTNYYIMVSTSDSSVTTGAIEFKKVNGVVQHVDATTANTSAVDTQEFNEGNTRYYACRLAFQAAGTMYLSFSNGTMTVSSNATNIGGGSSGTGASGMGTEVTSSSDANLLKILKKEDVMFYVYSYSSSYTWGLTKNSTTNYKPVTHTGSNTYGYTQVAISDIDTESEYVYISNNLSNGNKWVGNLNNLIYTDAADGADVPTPGGQYYDGTTSGNNSARKGTKTTATTTLNTSSFHFGETMIFSTAASATTSSYSQQPLKYRYYIKTGGVARDSGDKYYHLDIDDVPASTTAQLSGVDLFKFEPGSYTLITLGNDGNINYILDEDAFTVTELPASANAPTWNEVSGKLIINTSQSPSYIHVWTKDSSGTDKPAGTPLTYNSRNLYEQTAVTNPGAILKSGTGWNNTKLTDDIGPTTSSYDNYYTKTDSGTGSWSEFQHITSTLKVNNSTDAVTIGLSGSVTITNTPDGTLAKSTALGQDNDQAKYIYYVVRPNGTVNKVNSTWVDDTSYTFIPDEVGTYKVFCWVQDMWGYETRVSDNDMIIKVLQDYNVVTKTNDKNLGTLSVDKTTAIKDETVTVTVHENCGDYSSISVKDSSGNTVAVSGSKPTFTFTMPASNVTVRGTFTAVAGTSDWYYNGYDNSYNEMSSTNGDMYAKRMSLGKIGGQTYSYYQVQNRVDNQVFTISYGDLSDTNYVYFIQNDGWTDHHGWDADPQVQFLSSDGSKLKDWTTMTYDGTDGSDDAWKAKVPFGAYKVQFRTQKNDPSTNQWPYTTVQSLYNDVNKNCYYLSGYDANTQNQSQIATKKRGNSPAIANSHEKFYGLENTFNYLNAADAATLCDANGFQKQTGTHGGSHDFVKPTALGDNSGNYYVIVLYQGGDYTINGKSTGTLTANKVIWMDKLPGSRDEEPENTIDVYAKDGAAPINWNAKTTGGASALSGTAYNYAAIAKTTIVTIDGVAPETGDVDTYNVGDASSQYEYAKITPGSTINIKTTVASDYKSRFYVRGFCVNGVTYYGAQNGVENWSRINETPDTTTGEYTLTYTIPSDQTEPVEITPIYYYVPAQVPAGVDIVTFYLQGYTEAIQNDKGWGNTPYVYPFYGNLNNVDNAFGCYPGQPIVYVNGSYSIDVPVKNLSINSGDSDYNTTFIKGITISNGYADYVHKVKIYNWSQGSDNSDPDHMQTYDYDDFIKIYHEKTKEIDNVVKHPNTITFRMKDESADFQAKTYGGLAKNSQRVYNKDTNISDKISSIENGWEDLTNFFDEKVDLFGDKVTDYSLAPIYVVSTGYNANIAGDYGTAWMIYNSAGTSLLTTDTDNARYAVPPSIFLLRWDTTNNRFTYEGESPIPYTDADHSVAGAGSYTDSISKYKTLANNLYNNSAVKGHPVKIAYEKNTQDIRDKELGTGAHRMDGRWYYTFEDDTVQSDIKIEYYNTSTGAYVEETGFDSTTGASTGAPIDDFANPCSAKFTSQGSGTSLTVRQSGEQRIKTGNYQFNVTGNTGWTLEGLYLKYDGTYHKIVGGKLGNSSIPAEINATIVARFDPTNSGTLTINHNVLGTSAGSGTTTVSAVVNNGTTDVATYPASGTASSILIPDTYISNANSEYTITVTLTAAGSLDDTVKAFGLDSFNTAKGLTDPTYTPSTVDGASSATAVFSFKIGDLYSGGGKQITKILNYTSSFNATPHYYEFVYQYPSRGSATNDKSFTARGTFSSDDYDKYVTVNGDTRTVSPDFIKNVAPFQSNFNQDLSVYLSDGTNTNIDQTTSGLGYNSSNQTHKATVTYEATVKTYKAMFALPYAYKNDTGVDDGAGNAYKKYTADKSGDNVQEVDGVGKLAKKAASQVVPITGVTYEGYFLSAEATASNILKDSETPNHTNNAFITAPDKIWNPTGGDESGCVEYFSYWQVYDYRDFEAGKSIENMAKVTEVYYTDFNYRAYGDYYVVPVYSPNAADSYSLKIEDENNKTAKILYLGDSRNQWNTPANLTSNTWANAADVIYNDFAFSFSYLGKELINDPDSENFSVGMMIERVKSNDGSYYVKGDASVTDMNTYKVLYNSTETASKTKIQGYLAGTEETLGFAAVNVNDWTIDNTLNIKNRGEKYYYFTSQSGQTVEDHNIEFTNNSPVDDYVYRAYAYLIYDDGTTKEVIVSDPAYFSMRYTANR